MRLILGGKAHVGKGLTRDPVYTQDEQLQFAGRDLEMAELGGDGDWGHCSGSDAGDPRLQRAPGARSMPDLTGQQGQSTRAGTSEGAASTTHRTSPAEVRSIRTGTNTGIVPSENGC